VSGETEESVSGWTIDTLKAHVERRFNDLGRLLDDRDIANKTAMQAALAAAKEAVDKANTANEKRFEATNEFRAQLSDQSATFLPRSEADVKIGALAEKIITLEAAARSQKQLFTALGGIATLLISAAFLVIAMTR
jgi:hypothetical protein